MSIEHILFDVADTLLHTPDLVVVLDEVLREAGFSVPRVEIRRRHKMTREAVLFPHAPDRSFYEQFNARFLESLGISPTTELVGRIHERCSNLRWTPHEDVESLAALSQPLGILSNWDRSLNERLSQTLGRTFSPIIGSEAMDLAKPDPRIFEHAAEACGVDARRIAYIGDSVRLDMAPARRVGMRAILVDRFNFFPWVARDRVTSLGALPPLFLQ